jgi:hypothetical protein
MAGTFSRVKTWSTGETLTAAALNAEFDNILDNSDPDGIDDASANATAMQVQTDPYPAAAASLATDLRGEIERLRYQIAAILGETYWYIDPDTSIATLNTNVTSLQTLESYEKHRSKFVWSGDAIITIGAGAYHHVGTSTQVVYWNSSLAFTVGSGGSNALSEDLGASEWHYLYLDDTAIITQGAALLDADCFVNNTTAPSWSTTKHGWYNGSDRCIFAFYSDGDSDILEFFHNDDLVLYASPVEDRAAAALSTTQTDLTLSLPAFCVKAECTFHSIYADADAWLQWKTKDQTSGNPHKICYVKNGEATTCVNTLPVIANSSLKIVIYHSAGDTNQCSVNTDGWYFPIGM